jgi:hypothetical protein
MKTLRSISSVAFALALGLAGFGPTPALAQHIRVFSGSYNFTLSAAPDQDVRVTVLNPKFVAPAGDPVPLMPIYMDIQGVDATVQASPQIEPGAAYSFVIDPRTSGTVIDPRYGTRRVVVSFQIIGSGPDGATPPAPGVTVELVNRRTGESRIALIVPAVQAACEATTN